MVHQYKNNGYNIVLDVNSGSVHVVDDIAYDVIALYKEVDPMSDKSIQIESIRNHLRSKYSTDKIESAIIEVESLITEELLFTKDEYKEFVTDFKERKTVVKALCLHMAHDCNLACRYCFAEEGEYHGRRALMSLEVGKKALDFLIASSGNRVNLEVDFFGGEPLMNWDVVKELVKYGRSKEEKYHKKFRFTLTTNGLLLNDEMIDFANQEMSNVVLSLDGRKEIHDAMRPTRSGTGSYDLVVPKFQEFVKKRNHTNYFIRGTFTRNNLDFTKDVLHYKELGFTQLSMEPVVSNPEDPYSIKESDLKRICEEYDILAVEYLKHKKQGDEFHFFHFTIDLDQGPCVAKRLSGCGSGTEYLAVTPWGDLYPCHQFVGEEEFLLGNVDDGIVNAKLQNEFKLCNVYAKEKCQACFARYYCSGGCSANSYQFNHSIQGVYDIGCELERKRVECAIMIKAALADE